MTELQTEAITELNKLIHKRYSLIEIEDKVRNIFKNPYITIEEETKYEDDDKSDYNLIFENKLPNELYGFFDIYFLPTRKKNILYITEINYNFE